MLNKEAPEAASECDLVIIGAGLTGLSLACWLLELSRQTGQALPAVKLLESRTVYPNDRTWGFWDTEQHPFRHLISHRWPHWQVTNGQEVASQSSQQSPYAILSAGDVYQHGLACIDSCPEFSLERDTRVVDIAESADGVLVSSKTRQWRAKAVIDTRPPRPLGRAQLAGYSGFQQVFTGYEIYCPEHGYDLERAQLMDFQPCKSHVCFACLLPLDRNRLLVQWTEFHPGGDWADCTARLEEWLASQNILYYEVKRSESGVLPMVPMSHSQPQGRVIKAGAGAGWMRAATGYQFATCQRASSTLAADVLEAAASGNWLLAPPTIGKPWLNWVDKVFLRALHRYPEAGPDWFVELFSATGAEQMARFMSDEPTLNDVAAVAGALPKLPFLRAMFR